MAFILFFSNDSFSMCGGMIEPFDRTPSPVLTRAKNIENSSTKVALVRDGDSTVMTIYSNVKTKLLNFAMVIPVPTSISREQIRVVEPKVFEWFEEKTAAKLVENWDSSPCPQSPPAAPLDEVSPAVFGTLSANGSAGANKREQARLGITIEAHHVVGEYDIAIIEAKNGGGLVEWLNKFHYNVPPAAAAMFGSYIKQGNRFFVAKVNMKIESCFC